MYVKKLLKKLTVDYIRHTKSKTGYVSEKTMFLFSPYLSMSNVLEIPDTTSDTNP